MKQLLRCLLLLCLPILPARAALNPAIVGGDSRWVIYLDCNALRESPLGKQLIAMLVKAQPTFGNVMVRPDYQKIMATLGSITAYGANFTKDPKQVDGTLIIQGTDDLRKIAEGYLAQATVTSPDQVSEMKDPDLPFESYSVAGQVIVAFPPEPIILVSKSKTQLLSARQVFRGTAPSLANTDAAPLAGLLPKSSDAYLVAASVRPTGDFLPDQGPQTRILQMATSGALEIGETGANVMAHVHLVASSDAMADKLAKILQGVAAMMSLAQTDDHDLTDFLRSVNVTRDQQTVTFELAYSSDRLFKMLENTQHNRVTPPPRPGLNNGKLIAQWNANDDAEGVPAGGLATHTIENVHLVNGATLSLTGHRGGAEGKASLDSVEISPMEGSGPILRYRAEYMQFGRGSYRASGNGAPPGKKRIVLTGSTGTAQFSFPGDDGLYRLTVRYVPEGAEGSTFIAHVKDPEAAPAQP